MPTSAFFMMRPLVTAQDAAPAPLRLSVRPAPGGINIGFVKRRGPQRDEDHFIPIQIGSTLRFQPQRYPVQKRPAVAPVAEVAHAQQSLVVEPRT
jgi:protein ImuA